MLRLPVVLQLLLHSTMPSTRPTEVLQTQLDEILEECNHEEENLRRYYNAYSNFMKRTHKMPNEQIDQARSINEPREHREGYLKYQDLLRVKQSLRDRDVVDNGQEGDCRHCPPLKGVKTSWAYPA